MGYLSQAAALDVVANYDSSQSKRIVDMGGSQGMLLTKLLQASPNVEGVLFDRPNVISQARSIIDSLGMEDRVTLVSGDFFKEVLSGGNLYLLKQILHDWDDAQCLTILKNIRRAANSQSKFLVVEMLVPDEPEP
jgi:predicted O-methyltransferase YrrM